MIVNKLNHGSHSTGNIIFKDICRTKFPFPGQSIQDLKVINQVMYWYSDTLFRLQSKISSTGIIFIHMACDFVKFKDISSI